MQTKLYVTNLAQSASLSSVRECFGACGEVFEVEFVAERSAYQATSAAYVTMGSPVAAERAVRSLHGTVLAGRALVVSIAHQQESPGARRDAKKAKQPPATASIAQQYRERECMTYELECMGTRLTVRIFFPDESAAAGFRVEARTNHCDAAVEAREATREGALDAVADASRRLVAQPSLSELDWKAVAVALKSVRAV